MADVDKPQNLVPTAPKAPSDASFAALEQWILGFERSWRDWLIQKAHLTDDAASRLRVIGLRWNKESLLLASPDSLLDYATRFERRAEIETLLNACDPCPTTLADEDFCLRYREPESCMDKVISKITEGQRKYKKGRDEEDLLENQISPHAHRRAQVLKRCPDLERLLRELE